MTDAAGGCLAPHTQAISCHSGLPPHDIYFKKNTHVLLSETNPE